MTDSFAAWLGQAAALGALAYGLAAVAELGLRCIPDPLARTLLGIGASGTLLVAIMAASGLGILGAVQACALPVVAVGFVRIRT